jgi:phytol kinase
MIMTFLLTGLVAFLVWLGAEYLRRRLGGSNEVSRKILHMMHGILVAVWPFFIDIKVVIAFEIFVILMTISVRHFHWLHWMFRVGRTSWGDVLYPLGIITAALTAESVWIYFAAALILALADSAAAIVGKRYGKHHGYKIFGQSKSWIGSAAFFVVACLILGLIVGLSPLDLHGVAVITVLGLSAILTLTENVGVYGTDNFLLPTVTVLTLNLLG